MEKRKVGLKLAMDAMGLSVEVGSFDDRLILQKAIYLAQATGVHLGYYYRWYLRGPYCPAVAADGFAVSADLALGLDEFSRWELDGASLPKLTRICTALEDDDRSRLARNLELLASVHFLVKQEPTLEQNPAEIVCRLQKFHKDFTQEEVEHALGEMKDNGILS